MPCWLAQARYVGPGHRECGVGVQGGHTAHHVGRKDADGLVPGCGRAHDLYAGLGSGTTVRAFAAWMKDSGWDLEEVAMRYALGSDQNDLAEAGVSGVRETGA